MPLKNTRFVNPPEIAASPGYSHVVETTARRTVYVSGQVALDRDGNIVGPGDMTAQAIQVMENTRFALAAAGATFEHVIKTTTFVTDMSQLEALRAVRRQYFPTEPRPASTLVEVSRLVNPEWLLEMEVIAVLED